MQKITLVVILLFGSFLLFYRLLELMPFIGDQGWFYLAARNGIFSGSVPLIGVASSHPWLHQGAFWTYLLMIIFPLTHFNPFAPGVFTAGIGVFTIFLVYLFGKHMFNQTVALSAAFLYATSPLIIVIAREPYHTSLIPLLVLLFIYAFYRWLNGSVTYFPVTIFLIACLYNFEIATLPFTFILLLTLFYSIWKRLHFVRALVSKKILSLSFLAWFVPMLPMLIYDSTHGFPQTLKFILWLGYRFARLFGYPDIHGDIIYTPLEPFLPFTARQLQRLLFLPNQLIAVIFFIIIFVTISFYMYHVIKKKKKDVALVSLYLCFAVPFGSYIIFHTSSDAYWPMLIPPIIFVCAYAIYRLLFIKKMFVQGILLLIFVGSVNAYLVINQSYFMHSGNYPLAQRIEISKQIITQANGKKYTIIGKGPGSQFDSFTMNYEYLTWWLGNPSSKDNKTIKIQVEENNTRVSVRRIQ